MKKAQGLPISTIIIAILGLVVLVIIIMMVGVRLRGFGNQTAEAAKGEVCTYPCSLTKCDEPLYGNYVTAGGQKLGFNQVCCSKACTP